MYPYYSYYFDPTYILILIGVVLSLGASALVKSTYAKYKKVRSIFCEYKDVFSDITKYMRKKLSEVTFKK